MNYVFWIIGFLFLFVMYFFYKSYFFQFVLHRYLVKRSVLSDFRRATKGRFVSNAYFAPSHRVISKNEYQSLTNREKVNFSKCYNVVTFKTAGVEWELYFHLIKEGMSFTEVLNIRLFPTHHHIRSEGNVEKNYSRINVFTNNHYLTKILETTVMNFVVWLMRYDGDMLLISPNNLHFKAFIDPKKLNLDRAMDMVKALNGVKNGIYKKDVIEY